MGCQKPAVRLEASEPDMLYGSRGENFQESSRKLKSLERTCVASVTNIHKHGQYVLPSSRKRCDFSDHSSSRICSKVQIADKFAGEVKFIGSCMKPAGYLMFCHFFSKNEPDSCKSNLSSKQDCSWNSHSLHFSTIFAEFVGQSFWEHRH